jgi:hypothetical protein
LGFFWISVFQVKTLLLLLLLLLLSNFWKKISKFLYHQIGGMKPSGPSKCSTPSHTMSLMPQPCLWSKSNIPSFWVWNIYGYKVTSKSNRKLLDVLARLMMKLISHRIVVSIAMIPYIQNTMQPKYNQIGLLHSW